MVEYTLQEVEEKLKELERIKKELNTIEIICEHCGKKVFARKCPNPKFQKRFCSQSCRVVESAKRNHRDSNILRKKDPEKYKAIMRANYARNRLYWMSRVIINQFVKNGKINLEKKCKICGKDKEEDILQIHLEVFPTKKEEIIKEVKENKIYYLCKEHRDKMRVKIKQ